MTPRSGYVCIVHLRVDDRVGLSDVDQRALNAMVAPIKTLQDVVQLGVACSPSGIVEGVVDQDEYTRDVILRWRDDLVLVFDTT